MILARSFPKESEFQFRELIRRYVADVATQEWPMMAQGKANLRATPGVLVEALQVSLALIPDSEGQKLRSVKLLLHLKRHWMRGGSAS